MRTQRLSGAAESRFQALSGALANRTYTTSGQSKSRFGNFCRPNMVLLLIIGLCAFFGTALHAQLDSGSVTGTVSDSTHAVIPGAKITLKNDGTGVIAVTTSTATGTYAFEGVNPGSYTLQGEAAGFKTFVANGVEVHVQKSLTVDVPMVVGGAAQQVSVTEAAPLLQAEDAAIGQTIDAHAVNSLPLNGRDWVSLAQLSAGVSTAPPGQPTSTAGTTDSAYFSVDGVSLWQNDIRLDGINNNIEFYGGASVGTNATITPPPDAIQEFKLQNGDYSAEFGHSTGGIVNAVIKSGTNKVYGSVWEYFRNEALDANSYFNKLNGVRKPEFRQNQFGATIGGPVSLGKFYNGHDKTFFFGDYQGTRIVSPVPATSTVPTNGMRNSGYTNLQDLITFNSGTRTDALGRSFSLGTVLDPATTRSVQPGAVDPVSGLPNTTGKLIYVRDPFYSGSVLGQTNFVGQTALLNIIPANRIDSNAVKLLDIYPTPTGTGLANNFYNSPRQPVDQNAFDIRIDQNFNAKNILFGVFDKAFYTQTVPGTLPGIAIGQLGARNDSYPAWAVASGYTHVFTSTLTDETHFGYMKSGKYQQLIYGNQVTLASQYGYGGVPQIAGNGGIPATSISGLSSLGTRNSSPTLQTVYSIEGQNSVTKIFRDHSFKTGIQIDYIEGNILQPPQARGNFSFNGQYSDIPNQNSSLTGIADLLLVPTTSSIPGGTANGGINNLGGLSSFSGSNTATTNDHRYYIGAFFQDDWKLTPSLTVNLGLRWDYFPPYIENSGRQANFIAAGGNGATGTYYIPNQGCNVPRSSSFNALLTSSNITLACTSNAGLGQTQATNFGPRIGFAYRVKSNLVVRGGYGIAYGALGNIGYGGTLGTNYPFVYTVSFPSANSQTPLTLSNGQTATIENALTTVNLEDPTIATGQGVNLYGRQYNFHTPYIETFNLTVQQQVSNHDAIQLSYVGSLGRHLDNLGTHNSPSEILPPGTTVQNYVPFPNFAANSQYETTDGVSNYNSLQITYEHQIAKGLSLISNYTFSKCLSDQRALNHANANFRGQWLPGFGIGADRALCDVDATQVVHIAGSYALPVGRGLMFLNNTNRIVDAFLGGWSANYLFGVQTGQPFSVSCPIATTSGFGCNALVAPGTNIYASPRGRTQWLNPNAFVNPAKATSIGQTDYSVLGGPGQQARGPGFYNLDASIFKEFSLEGRAHVQFRAESFNALNHTQFGQPGSLDFTNKTAFSQITSLRNTARQVQFALKVLF